MRLERPFLFLALIVTSFLFSCEKKESAIVLPPKGSAELVRIETGEDYEDQVFFDFETGQIVQTSKVKSWDLAFEASPTGYHIFMNGDKNIYIHNTHNSNIAAIPDANSLMALQDTAWKADASCGLPDSTGIGEWKNSSGLSKNEVYVLKFGDDTYKKFVLESVTTTGYVFKYGDLDATSLQSIEIPKNTLYNFTYFSFDNGGKLVTPEPPKATWDIVFTRYRFFYYNLNNFPYLVSGVLLNPYNTSARVDTTSSFVAVEASNAIASHTFSNHRDAIGWRWKTYNFTNGRYEVDPSRTYIIKTRKGQYWKMHFLNFYNSADIKGSPSFEYERIQ